MSQQRSVPAFAPQTFRSWFERRQPANPDGTLVMLWPDTFNNYFLPDTAKAGSKSSKPPDFASPFPTPFFAAGGPLRFRHAGSRQAAATQTFWTLWPRKSRPEFLFVVLEPSCAAVFRDELTNLFPEDARAPKSFPGSRFFSANSGKESGPFSASETPREGPHPRPLSSQGTDEDDRPGVGSAKNGHRLERPGAGLLRNGRLVRLRRRKYEGLHGDRRAGTPCPRSGRPQPTALIIRRRIQLPRTDLAVYRTDTPCIWQR